jgi:AcrR family transcriptional regulator
MPRPPKITNEAILAAAREVFLAQGEGASTLDIAEKAGISEATIFKRFTTKQALFLKAIGITETAQYVKILTDRQPTAEIRFQLAEIATEILEFYRAVMPRVFMMMTQTKSSLPPFLPPPIRDGHLLAQYLDRAIELGYVKPCNSVTVAHAIIGAIHTYVMTQTIATKMPFPTPFVLPKLKEIEPTIFIDSLIETVWVGIAPDRHPGGLGSP